ncbi:MAG: SMC family ATPase, partial [Candidatus Methanomethylophilaceae archaeon]|nr:SMC family ATPase [Candidatus Methanomethylophilaceae archaeon]
EASFYHDQIDGCRSPEHADRMLELLSLHAGVLTGVMENIDMQRSELSKWKDDFSRQLGEAESVNKTLDDLESKKKRLCELESSAAEIVAKRGRLSELKVFRDKVKGPMEAHLAEVCRLEDIESRIPGARTELEEALGAMDQAKQRSESKPGLEAERQSLSNKESELKGTEGEYEAIDGLRRELAGAESQLKQMQGTIDGLQGKKAAFDATVDKYRRYLIDTENAGEALARTEEERDRTEAVIKDLRNAIAGLEKLEPKIDREGKLAMSLQEGSEELKRISIEFAEEKDRFYRAQAGILATGLKDGVPCPVCGSVDHPHPAEIGGEVASKEELDSMESAIEENRKKVDSTMSSLSELRSEIAGLKSSFTDTMGRLGYSEETSRKELQSRLSEAESKKAELAKKVSAYNGTVSERERINAELNGGMDQEREMLEKEIQSIGADIAVLSDQATRLRTVIEERESKLKFPTVGELYVELRNLTDRREEITSIIRDIDDRRESASISLTEKQTQFDTLNGSLDAQRAKCDDSAETFRSAMSSVGFDGARCEGLAGEVGVIPELETEISGYDSAVDGLKAAIAALEEQVSGKERVDTASLEESLRQCETDIGSLDSVRQSVRDEISSAERSATDIRQRLERLRSLSPRAEAIIQLDKVCKGDNANMQPFESYVQSIYFDEVLSHANQRLDRMTDGRYELLLREEAIDKRSKGGLEINVRDNYTGRERPASTLSGGESFQAALSLALGLSDAVQNMKGGVRIDTLFIDEGFGSLDPVSLRQAIATLADLGSGECLVGIISHVEALKREIDRKIVVERARDGKGSSLTVEL